MDILKRILAVMMTIIMLAGIAPLSGLTALKSSAASKYKTGDIVFFGSYPQSKVTDRATLAQLNAAPQTWYSYNYMSGAGTNAVDGSAQPSDYMQYCDVTVGKYKYRGVKFSTYRPYFTNYRSTTSTDYTYQDDNGYKINKTYWFKYEPLKWRVLDPSEGLVLCENIIDSQAFSNTVSGYYSSGYRNSTGAYISDYESSSIREWLNDDFYNTAFSSAQQSKIVKTHLENKHPHNSTYDSTDTDDNIFLLSYWDILNTSYGFSLSLSADVNKRAHSTDYAKCQGVYTNSYVQTADGEDTSDWRLRTPNNHFTTIKIDYFGNVTSDNESHGFANDGIRPALRVDDLDSLPSATKDPEITLSFDKSSYDVAVDDEVYLLGSIESNMEMPSDFKLEYSLSDTTGAAFVEGRDNVVISTDKKTGYFTLGVKGLHEGDYTLTASAGDSSASCTIHVIKQELKADFKLKNKEYKFINGDIYSPSGEKLDYIEGTLTLTNTAALDEPNQNIAIKDIKIRSEMLAAGMFFSENNKDVYTKEISEIKYGETKSLPYKIKIDPVQLNEFLGGNVNSYSIPILNLEITAEHTETIQKDIEIPINYELQILKESFAFNNSSDQYFNDADKFYTVSDKKMNIIKKDNYALYKMLRKYQTVPFDGACFGMSMAVSAFHSGRNLQAINAENVYNLTAPKSNPDLRDFLIVLHLAQYTDSRLKESKKTQTALAKQLINALKDIPNSGVCPVLGINGKDNKNKKSNHAVVAYNLIDQGDKYQIWVYDCLNPSGCTSIYITKDFKFSGYKIDNAEYNKIYGVYTDIDSFDITSYSSNYFKGESPKLRAPSVKVNDLTQLTVSSESEQTKSITISKSKDEHFEVKPDGTESGTLNAYVSYPVNFSGTHSDLYSVIIDDNGTGSYTVVCDEPSFTISFDRGSVYSFITVSGNDHAEIYFSNEGVSLKTNKKVNCTASYYSGSMYAQKGILSIDTDASGVSQLSLIFSEKGIELKSDNMNGTSAEITKYSSDFRTDVLKKGSVADAESVLITNNKNDDSAVTITEVKECNVVKSVSVSDMNLNYKKSATLNPTITADEGVNYTVKYESSNPKVATVDQNGKVYGAKKGSADIKVTVTDSAGNTVTDTCNVKVKYSFGQWLIVILLFGWIWY